jgi:exopolyphosphatase / guanosine-5'-triphosphate,3'-diphosphate pyrophosphatase
MRPGSGAVAAIDCGTNSTRLLVAGPGGEARARLMRITRLGRGVDLDRRLAPDAIERTVAVLREYREVMDAHGVGQVRMTATSAARDAANRREFFRAAEEAVGVRPELLDGDEEGRLSFAGATAELDPAEGPWLVADIGGGSTELAAGPGAEGPPTAVCSLDVGCVRITERFLTSDPPAPRQLAAARRFVAGLLQTVSRDQPDFARAATLVGLAGTVAALAAIDQGLPTYDRARVHHYVLTREVVEGLLSALAAESTAARQRRPGVEPDRADVIVGGTVVLAEVMSQFGFGVCLTSEADILDGLVQTLLKR